MLRMSSLSLTSKKKQKKQTKKQVNKNKSWIVQ